MSSFFVVNHVSDEEKVNGLVRGSETRLVTQENEDGTTSEVHQRIHFVHWPNFPHPLEHEELNEELVFDNIYTPEHDLGDDQAKLDEFEEIQAEVSDLLEEMSEEEFAALPEAVKGILGNLLPDEGEEDEEGEESEEVEEVEEQ